MTIGSKHLCGTWYGKLGITSGILAFLLILNATFLDMKRATQCNAPTVTLDQVWTVQQWNDAWAEACNVLNGQIDNTNIAGTAAIAGSKLADDSVTATQLASNAVGSGEIVDGSVTTVDIDPNSITSALITDGTIDTADLKDASVTEPKLAFTFGPSVHARLAVDNEAAAASGTPYSQNVVILDPGDTANDVPVDIEACGDWVAVLIDNTGGNDRIDFFSRATFTVASRVQLNLTASVNPVDMTCDSNGLLWVLMDSGTVEQIKTVSTGATPAIVDDPWRDISADTFDDNTVPPDLVFQIMVDPNVEFVYVIIQVDDVDGAPRDLVQYTVANQGATRGSYSASDTGGTQNCTAAECRFNDMQYLVSNGNPRIAVAQSAFTGAASNTRVVFLDPAAFDTVDPSDQDDPYVYHVAYASGCQQDSTGNIAALTFDGEYLMAFDPQNNASPCEDGWIMIDPSFETTRILGGTGVEPHDAIDVAGASLFASIDFKDVIFDGVFHRAFRIDATSTESMWMTRLRAGWRPIGTPDPSDTPLAEEWVYGHPSAFSPNQPAGATSDGAYVYILIDDNAVGTADFLIKRMLIK